MLKSQSTKRSFRLVLAFGVLLLAAPSAASAQVKADLDIPSLVEVLNEDRVEAGLHPLRRDADLDAAAKLKAEDMVKNGYFSHTSPEGLDPWHWFKEISYDYIYAGENLALDFYDEQNVQDAWMASPKHKANMLNPEYEDVGYAIAIGTFTNINGVQKVRSDVTVIVQLFGKRVPRYIAADEPLLSPAGYENIQSNGVVLGKIALSLNSLSSKFLTQSYNSQFSPTGQIDSESLPQSSSPVSLPLISLGLVMLMTTAGFHTRLIV